MYKRVVDLNQRKLFVLKTVMSTSKTSDKPPSEDDCPDNDKTSSDDDDDYSDVDTSSDEYSPDIDDFFMIYGLIVDKKKSDALTFIHDLKLTNQDYIRVCLNCNHDDYKHCLPSLVAAAAISNDTDLLNELVSLGFDPNAPCVGDWGIHRTPIAFACNAGCFKAMKVLVREHNVDVNTGGQTALRIAVANNRFGMVKFLLQNGADVNAIPMNAEEFTDETTSLHTALESNQNIKLCEHLISKGADVNKGDYSGSTPLHSLCSAIYDIGDRTVGADFRLHMAKSLLAKGANVNARDNQKNTPFQDAVKTHGLELLKVLYANGADPEAGNDFYPTIINAAVVYGTYEITRYLVIDLNYSLNKEVTVLDVCGIEARGRSPLHLALYFNRPEFARLIVQAGYDLQQEDWIRNGEDPFSERDYAADIEGRKELIEEIRNFSQKVRSLRELCCFKVRHLLGRRIPEALTSFPLPNPVKDFIRLTHIE